MHQSSREFLLTSMRLSWVARVLFGIFVISLLSTVLPLRLLDPAWQNALIGSLLNFALFPLIGLGLLHLAADLTPENSLLRQRRRNVAHVAVAATFGFLLLIVLQFWVFWQQITVIEAERYAPVRRGEQTVASIRKVLQRSGSTAEILTNLRSLKAPPFPDFYTSLPLPDLRRRLQSDLVIADQQLRGLREETRATIRKGRIAFLGLALRNCLTALLFALGFAALAKRRRCSRPLLEEWQMMLARLMVHLPLGRNASGDSTHAQMDEYIDTLSTVQERGKRH